MTFPSSFVTKRGSSFRYKSNNVFRGKVSIEDIFVTGSVFLFEGCSEDLLHLFFTFQIHCSYFVIANLIYILLYI